jgi:hypothetical protein
MSRNRANSARIVGLRSVVRRVWLGVGAVLALGAWLGACSSAGRGSASSSTGPATSVVQGTILKVADFPAAVAAVEAARGGPQQLVEVNATPDGVNVFAAADATHEVAYFYEHGTLQAPGAPAPISSAPFDRTGIDLGLGSTLVERTQQQFPGATVVSVALLQLPDGGLRWALRSRSPLGGLLNVIYTPSGELVSVAPAQEPAG